MYGLSDRLKPLSAAEEQVLLAVWACRPPATRRDIGEKLAAKGWAPATVLNFLYRLEKKGWVKSGKDQNRNTYTPTVTRRAYGVAAMRERLDTVFGGDLAEAVRALVSESGCGQSELEQAMAVLAEKHGADYLGVGAVFPTGSKDDADDVSYETLKAICGAVSIPVVAIGGITQENVAKLAGSGICGVAVISAIYAAKNIQQASTDLKAATEKMLHD